MNLEDTVIPYSALSDERKKELIEKRRAERFRSKSSTSGKSKVSKKKVKDNVITSSGVKKMSKEEARDALEQIMKLDRTT